MLILYIILLLCPILWLYIHKRKYRHVEKRFPAADRLPIIGSLHLLVPIKDAIPTFLKVMGKVGPNTLVYIFHRPYLLLTGVKEVEFILSSNKIIDKSEEYSFPKNWFGTGLLTSTGYKWKSHRKILTPSFHYKILEEFVKVFDEKSFILVDKLKKYVGKDRVNVHETISLFTLDVICETAMGTKVNALDNPDLPYLQSIEKITEVFIKRSLSPLRNGLLFYLSSLYTLQEKCLKVLLAFSNSIIRKRREALQNSTKETDDNDIGLKKKYTFLDVLLNAKIDGQVLSNEDIREEVDTFIFEGHDTTAVAISYCLYLLSKHTDIQEETYKEVISIMGEDKKANVTYEILNSMKYLEQVIKESLRLYPSVYIFSRTFVEDTDFDGTLMPKGLTVILSPFLMHRDPNLYPDPLKFDPDRFTPDEQAKRHPYAYIPFSAGPRNCIGQKFAMLELKCTIAKLLRHYRILPVASEHNVVLRPGITLQTYNGINIRLEERT